MAATDWESRLAAIVAEWEEGGRAALEKALTLEEVEAVRGSYLGRKGKLALLLRELGALPLEEKRRLGPRAQDAKRAIEEAAGLREKSLADFLDRAALKPLFNDPTLPGFLPPRGGLHPLTRIVDEVAEILLRLGFDWAEGPLIETERYNFEVLNIPEHHPSRDLMDTFYVSGAKGMVLRTHTSPVQGREMEKRTPPLRIFSPGRVFRRENVDATHSAVFHQIEGLCVDEGIGFADLKGTLEVFLKALLGPETKLRFRPSYFPFTEPSAEVDVQCFSCHGSGCGLCKRTGYIEMLGSGVVHSNVLKACGVDPGRWSGFAFGMGVERIAMLRWGVTDIRAFYESDVRVLGQFSR